MLKNPGYPDVVPHLLRAPIDIFLPSGMPELTSALISPTMLRAAHQALFACMFCMPAFDALAQERTIPEILASTTHDVGDDIRVNFGKLPTLDSVISGSELVVRGKAAVPNTFLSADQTLLYSDYEILEARVLDDPNDIVPDDTAPSLMFRQVGGNIMMYGYRYFLTQENCPPLVPQREYLFLLKRVDDHFESAGLYFGIFEFMDNRLTSIGVDGFAPELNTLTADDALAHILSRVQAVRR